MVPTSLLLTAVLFLLAGQPASSQSDDTTECSKLDFKSLPSTCCKNPFGMPFNEKALMAMKKCKPSKKVLEWANYYKINTLQQKDFGNFIDENNANTKKELCSAGAFMECVFTELELMNDTGSLDLTKIQDHLNEVNADQVWKDMVYTTITPLDPYFKSAYKFTDILEDRFESVECSGETVNLIPLMLAQMIQSEFIWMCPEQEYYNSKNKCRETMKNYQYCDGKIYSPLAKGVFYFPYV